MIVQSNPGMVQQMESLSQRVSLLNSSHQKTAMSDDMMMELFVQANSNMLETMKRDPTMHQQFVTASRSADMEMEMQTANLDLVHTIEDEHMGFLDQPQPQFAMPNMIELY